MNVSFELHDTAAVAARVEQRLANIVGTRLYAQLRKALQESGAVLSGSFVLQCIIGEHWHDSDIDAFIPINPGFLTPYRTQTSPLDNWLHSQGATIAQSLRTDFTSDGRYGDFLVGSQEKKLTAIRDYLFCDTKFQLIHTNRATPEQVCAFVRADFDFSVLKNTFHIDASGAARCSVEDWAGIEARRCMFAPSGNIRSSLRRRRKYEERGFEIYCYNPWPILVKQVQLHNRRKGFKVQFVDEALCTDIRREWRLQQLRTTSVDIDGREYSECSDADCSYRHLSAWHLHHIAYESLHTWGPIVMRNLIIVHPDTFRLDRAVEILMALQNLRLPVLILCQLLDLLDCNADYCAPTKLWELVALVRHFKEKATLKDVAEAH